VTSSRPVIVTPGLRRKERERLGETKREGETKRVPYYIRGRERRARREERREKREDREKERK